ncbi:MAG: hypothetical protein HYZ93_05500 [Candidatus Omnitrophica bacterium]|nr:hypothetical protein [Candidatus Omnitrophota bacterium]
MKRMLFASLLAGIIAWSTAGFAAECSVCSAAGSESYTTKAVGQLARGAANTGMCWVEMVNQPVKEVKGGGNVLIGVGKGVGHTCLRLAQGVGEIITCPMPKAKDGKYTQIADGCPLGVMGVTDR